MLLALNETRKTLLASRIEVRDEERSRAARGLPQMLPGDGVWFTPCRRVDVRRAPNPVDLMFLDAQNVVVETMINVVPGMISPEVDGSVGVLGLPAGTIRFSQTEKGDLVAIERILPEAHVERESSATDRSPWKRSASSSSRTTRTIGRS
jgi:hypothetical protein